MARRVWTVEQGERRHVITLEHGHWSGRRRIRVDDELVHESRVLFDLGSTRHRFQVDDLPLALIVRANGATYGYDVLLDVPGNPRSTEPAPALAHPGSGDEPVPVAPDADGALAGLLSGSLEPDAGQAVAAEPPPPIRIHALTDRDDPARVPHVGKLFDASFGVLTLALFAALIGAALNLPAAGALGSALVVGVAGAFVGRRRGERAGGETLFGLLGGLLGAGLGLGLGSGVFGLLLIVILALMLLAPLPGIVSD
jgi:Fas apoptotic inhibitory molecule (FAIM1)